MSKEIREQAPRGRIGAAYASGVATGILATLLALIVWARLMGPPRTAYSASPANAPAVAPPAVNAPAPAPANSPAVSAPEESPPTAPNPEPVPAPEVQPAPRPEVAPSGPVRLLLPVSGIPLSAVHDTYNDMRGSVRHEALDIMAPIGTPVVAAGDGMIRKLFESRKGGHTVYQFNPDATLCYYYAHLDRYAPSLKEGQTAHRGDLIGYVGASGNADPGAPHLHFAVTQLDPDRKWWTGKPVDPYPLLEGVVTGSAGTD